jgi:magnesium chelatase subunit D
VSAAAVTAVAPVSDWDEAAAAAALFAVDPVGTGGVVVRSLPGPVRDRWLARVRALLPPDSPMRRIPLHVADSRLLGGLDLTATLRAGRPVAERGILAEADGGVVVLAMAERLSSSTAARFTAALDAAEVVLARDGIELRHPSRFGVVVLDEGITDGERAPPALLDRLAFHVDLSAIRGVDIEAVEEPGPETIAAARARLPDVDVSDAVLEALCATAAALGIASLRPPLLALRVARAAAALAGRNTVSEEDAVRAGRLVLAPRATALPALEQPEPEPRADDGTPPEAPADQENNDDAVDLDRPLEDILLEAAQAAIPAGLLEQLKLAGPRLSRARSSGKAGALQHSGLRGRPAGVRRGEPRAGIRLNVVETLRAAAPWQRLRRRDAATTRRAATRIEVRPEDFHVTRYHQRAGTTTIFVVDASGSSALHRLAEAKGAVELLLADCYVRRDRVAVLAFRGRGAEILLPPTRSLVRAKRSLASLPGGGGTPLAAGIEAAVAMADVLQRRGETPTVVLLTDGRANIARDGTPGRARAEEEALAAARRARVARITTLLVDTSPRPQPVAARLATAMGALYIPLPHADAVTLSRAVRTAAAAS